MDLQTQLLQQYVHQNLTLVQSESLRHWYLIHTHQQQIYIQLLMESMNLNSLDPVITKTITQWNKILQITNKDIFTLNTYYNQTGTLQIYIKSVNQIPRAIRVDV